MQDLDGAPLAEEARLSRRLEARGARPRIAPGLAPVKPQERLLRFAATASAVTGARPDAQWKPFLLVIALAPLRGAVTKRER